MNECNKWSEKEGKVPALLLLLQGTLIGLGAVLPGISGGVLCVVFGIYKPIMEVLAEPFHAIKKYIRLLFPVGIGVILGFLGIAKLLGFLLNCYPELSICVFVGLITGMLPSLFREAGEKGRNIKSYFAIILGFFFLFSLLSLLKIMAADLTPSFGWYLFCGFCLALSIIAPGMSFSTLLMPLGLYTPFVEGIGGLKLEVIIPGAAGAVFTIILLARIITYFMENYYSILFHGIIGIVIAATIAIIPFESFQWKETAFPNICCIIAGIVIAFFLGRFNDKIETTK